MSRCDLIPAGAVLALSAGCMELSPFETDLHGRERGITAKQLARLDASPQAGEAFSFALVSDTHTNADDVGELVQVLNAREDLAFVALLGDLTNMGLRREFRAMLDQLEALAVPFVTVVGNHDVLAHGREIYRSMFGPFDYTFTYANIRFVAFNANALEFPGEGVPDLDWLREASAPDPDLAGVIVLSHQPLEEPAYLEILADNGVLVTLGGHIHRFRIREREGVLAATAGAAKDGDWALVSVDGAQVRVSECSLAQCTPRTPP